MLEYGFYGNPALLSAAVFVFFAASTGARAVAADFFGFGLDGFLHSRLHEFFYAWVCRDFHRRNLARSVSSVRLHSALIAKRFIQRLKLYFVCFILDFHTKVFHLFQNRLNSHTFAAEKEEIVCFLFQCLIKM